MCHSHHLGEASGRLPSQFIEPEAYAGGPWIRSPPMICLRSNENLTDALPDCTVFCRTSGGIRREAFRWSTYGPDCHRSAFSMAVIKPFRGVRYNPELFDDLCVALSQPHDRIDKTRQEQY